LRFLFASDREALGEQDALREIGKLHEYEKAGEHQTRHLRQRGVARHVFIVCMSLGNLVLGALDLPAGERSSCEKILEQQAGNAWLIVPVKRLQLLAFP